MRPVLTSSPLLQALRESDPSGTPPVLRLAALRREHWICRYCGAPATEVDHVLPRAQGGLTMLPNLAASCRPCNRSKGDRTPEEWQRDEAAKRLEALMAHRRTRRGRIETAVRKSRSFGRPLK